MLSYFQTSIFILIWVFIFGFVETWVVFLTSEKIKKTFFQFHNIFFPTIIIAPLVIVGFYRLFSINLIFPIHFFSTLDEIFWAALPPGFVLWITSGLMTQVFYNISQEKSEWLLKPCSLVARAYGFSPEKKISLLVVKKSLLESLEITLPWIFCELIIIECIFNAPGLGFDLWTFAKEMNLAKVFELSTYILSIYFFILGVTFFELKKLGKKLSGY